MGIPALLAVLLALLLVISGCGASKITVTGAERGLPHEVKKVAIIPSSSDENMGETIAFELSSQGLQVLDENRTANLFSRLGITARDIDTLRSRHIDAYLTVTPSENSKGLLWATARVSSTHTGETLFVVTWEKGSSSGNPVGRFMLGFLLPGFAKGYLEGQENKRRREEEELMLLQREQALGIYGPAHRRAAERHDQERMMEREQARKDTEQAAKEIAAEIVNRLNPRLAARKRTGGAQGF